MRDRVAEQLAARGAELVDHPLDRIRVLVHSASSSPIVRSRRATTLRRRPRVGTDAVEVALDDVGGDAAEMGDKVVGSPFGRGRDHRGVAAVIHEHELAFARGRRDRPSPGHSRTRGYASHGGGSVARESQPRGGRHGKDPQDRIARGLGGRSGLQQLRHAHRRRAHAGRRRCGHRRGRHAFRHRRELRGREVGGVHRRGARQPSATR